MRSMVLLRYFGLCVALLSTLLMLYVFKIKLNQKDTAFLLSAIGTSGYAIFFSGGYGKPFFQHLSNVLGSKDVNEEIGALALYFVACASLGGVVFSVAWIFFAGGEVSPSKTGVFLWIAAYATNAAIQPLRDISYCNGCGKSYEILEFIRRIGSFVSVVFLFVDDSCMLSGVFYYSVSIISVAISAHVNTGGERLRVEHILLMSKNLKIYWRDAIKYQTFTFAELALYSGPYLYLSAIGDNLAVISYAYFQRLFQGITTFTRVVVDVEIYSLVGNVQSKLLKLKKLIFQSFITSIPFVLGIAVLWDILADYLLHSPISPVLGLAVSLMVFANCIIHAFGTYLLLTGDNYIRMAAISMLAGIAMAVTIIVIVTNGFNVAIALLISTIYFFAIAVELYSMTRKSEFGHE